MTRADATDSATNRLAAALRVLAERARRIPIRLWAPPLALLVLGACAVPNDAATGDEGFIAELPEAVAALAAPNQDLTAVRLREDGCYWYRYEGPVEATMLPLRTVDGRPICARVPDHNPAG